MEDSSSSSKSSNSFHRKIGLVSIALVGLIVVLVLVNHILLIPPEAGASGAPCGLILDLKEYVFDQSETVPIEINDTCYLYSGKVITIVVSSPDGGINENGIATVTPGSTFSTKTLTITGRTTETTINLPKDAEAYTFLITVKDDKNEIKDQALVFSKVEANIVRVTEFLVPVNITAGSQLKVAATIRDGLDNPMPPIVTAIVRLQRPECSNLDYLGTPLDLSLKRSDNPSKYVGQALVPYNFSSGVYTASLSVYLSPYKGYQQVPEITSDVDILGGDIPITTLFHNIEEMNATLFSQSSMTGKNYAPGDDIVLGGQVMTDDCHPLSGVRVTGDFFDLPTPLIRAVSVSDSSGNFSMHFQTYPSLSTDSQYFIRLKADYSNKTFTWFDDYVTLKKVTRYPFESDGRASRAEVKANGEGTVKSVTLNKDLKKLTIIVESQKYEEAQYTIAIPSNLLSGDIIVLKDGGEPLLLNDQYFGDQSGPELDPGFDSRHSYYLSASKTSPYLLVDYVNLSGGETRLEITGTSVIPEFGVVIPSATLALSIMYVLVVTLRSRHN